MSTSTEAKFTWASLPTTQVEFERLMPAMDAVLEDRGIDPSQRVMHIPRLLWEAFGWSGSLFPDSDLAKRPGFQGEVLFAKVRDWYQQIYGDRMNVGIFPGGVPVRLGNALWRLRFPLVYGAVEFIVSKNLSARAQGGVGQPGCVNMLDCVEGLTPALAERLDDAQLSDFTQFFVNSIQVEYWRASLPRLPLLEVASKDYDASTADLLARRYGQARWGAQQAVEKTFKAVLKHSGVAVPSSGPNGHNLTYLGNLLNTHFSLALDATLLEHATCSPKVRYNEQPSSEVQALQANHAVLGLLAALRDSVEVSTALANPPAESQPVGSPG